MLNKLKSIKLLTLKLPKQIKFPKLSKSAKTKKPASSSKSSPFDKKKAAKVASSVILCGVSGWVVWSTFLAVPEPAAPPVLPQTTATINPASVMPAVSEPIVELQPIAESDDQTTLSNADEMIEQLLVVSGWKKQIDEMPNQILQGFRQAAANDPNPAVDLIRVENMIIDAFDPAPFKHHMHAALKDDFDIERAQRLLDEFNQPWLMRVVELEKMDVQPLALERYAAGLGSGSLSEQRLQAFREYDETFMLTEFMIELSSGMARTMLDGFSRSNGTALTSFDNELNRHMMDLKEIMRDQVYLLLAYVYRELNDDELQQYVDFVTSDDGIWLNTTLMQAMLDKMNSGAMQIGKHLAASCDGNQSCGDETLVVDESTTLENSETTPQRYALTARSNLDARECLELGDNMAIHRCAENFR